MKFLLFSDLHLDTPFAWAPPSVARDRRRALRDTLVRIGEVAEENDVDAVLSGGDLYEHERSTPDTGAFLASTFGAWERPVFLAPGNHDWLGPSSLYATQLWPDNVHVYEDSELAATPLTDGLTLWGAAHRAPANTPNLLEGFRVDRAGVNLALFHGSELGGIVGQGDGKIPHAPFRASDIVSAGLDHAMLGHFHSPRDAERHTYPGNPDPLSFGESGDRGAVILTVLDDGSVHRERVVVAADGMHDVAVDLSGITNSSEIGDRVADAVRDLQGVARVTLTGEVDPDVPVTLDGLDQVGGTSLAVVARLGRIDLAYDIDDISTQQTVRGQFVRDVQASDLDAETQRKVLATGLRALDGRTGELEVS